MTIERSDNRGGGEKVGTGGGGGTGGEWEEGNGRAGAGIIRLWVRDRDMIYRNNNLSYSLPL